MAGRTGGGRSIRSVLSNPFHESSVIVLTLASKYMGARVSVQEYAG